MRCTMRETISITKLRGHDWRMVRCFLFFIAFALAACIICSTTALADSIVKYIERNGSAQINLEDLFDKVPEDCKITTRAIHGRAVMLEDKKNLLYFSDGGFQGFDRFTVGAKIDNQPVEKTFHITVGQPVYSETDIVYEKVVEQLFALALVAIFLEIALSAVFRNRLFQKADLFPGIKTILSFLAGLLVVFSFDFNIFREVMQALQDGAGVKGAWSETISGVITASLLAGGTSTVFFLYTKLGIRNPFKGGKDGPGLTGSGTLKLTVHRGANVADTEQVAIQLDKKLLGVLQGGQTIFGGEKGYELQTDVYTVKARANDKNGSPAEVSRLTVIEPNKPTEIELSFA